MLTKHFISILLRLHLFEISEDVMLCGDHDTCFANGKISRLTGLFGRLLFAAVPPLSSPPTFVIFLESIYMRSFIKCLESKQLCRMCMCQAIAL